MGKITGFLEYGRESDRYTPALARIKNYDEFLLPPDAEKLRIQAARCMDCGVPFCHAGFLTEGQSIGCPLGNLIPEINDLAYNGDFEGAFERLTKTHPFPEFTSRVCPALCEGSCTLGEHREPVAVKAIERFIIDGAVKNGLKPKPPETRTGKKVAVIGSGPAGLACADRLNKLGDTVTVFERADRAGGLLTYGIPNMKLDKKTVSARVSLMEKEGVKFITNAQIGVNYPAIDIVKNFDAAVICVGAGKERVLSVKGADLKGVHTAMTYLTAATKGLLNKTDSAVTASGKDVIIIGGGDTGTDCVATAVRQGAKSVTQLEIMPEPPEKRSASNPWPLWPRVKKTDYGQKEAIELFGRDPRRFSTTATEIVGKNGAVTGVKTVSVEWVKENGKTVPKEKAGTEATLPASLIITAMGFICPEKTLIDALSLKTDARGMLETDGFKTNLSGIFAAGDARRGPSLVVWAILEGIKAADECHAFICPP